MTLLEKTLNQNAAAILAVALLELYPGLELLSCQEENAGFVATVSLPPKLILNLSLIEDKMKQICKENRPIKVLEMLPSNAGSYLEHLGVKAKLREDAPLVQLFQMGNTTIPCEGRPLSSSQELQFFTLTELSADGHIRGVAFKDKTTLQQFKKGSKTYDKDGHLPLGEKLFLFKSFTNNQLLWYPKGIILKELLIDYCKQKIKTDNYAFLDISSPKNENDFPLLSYLPDLFDKFPTKRFALKRTTFTSELVFGLLESLEKNILLEYTFTSYDELENELKESLKEILSTLAPFGLKYNIALYDKRFAKVLDKLSLSYEIENQGDSKNILEFYFNDFLGKKWAGPFLALLEKSKIPYIDVLKKESFNVVLLQSRLGYLERLIAIILESHGDIPFWLAPEQLRIFPLNEENIPFAKKLKNTLLNKGGRATMFFEGNLKDKMEQAKKEQIPLIVVIGSEEEAHNTVSFKRYGSSKIETINIEKFLTQWEAKGV